MNNKINNNDVKLIHQKSYIIKDKDKHNLSQEILKNLSSEDDKKFLQGHTGDVYYHVSNENKAYLSIDIGNSQYQLFELKNPIK